MTPPSVIVFPLAIGVLVAVVVVVTGRLLRWGRRRRTRQAEDQMRLVQACERARIETVRAAHRPYPRPGATYYDEVGGPVTQETFDALLRHAQANVYPLPVIQTEPHRSDAYDAAKHMVAFDADNGGASGGAGGGASFEPASDACHADAPDTSFDSGSSDCGDSGSGGGGE